MPRILSVLFALSTLSLAACGGKPAGKACNPDKETPCADGLVCDVGPEGEHVCLIPLGGECDPDEDPDWCQEGSCTPSSEDMAVCALGRGDSCDPEGEPCGEGLECEPLASGGHACFEPFYIDGMITDATDNGAVEGARVIAIDAAGSATGDVGTTDAEGNYSARLVLPRTDEGDPIAESITLRVGAAGFQPFPSGIRSALPIDPSEATFDEERWTLENTLTSVALIPIPDDGIDRFTVQGTVEHELAPGTLVVAHGGDGAASTAIADSAHRFVLFNVPAGSWDLRGYRANLQLNPATVSVDDADVTDVKLEASETGTSTVDGSVQLVNAGGADSTSVTLYIDDTYVESFERGESAPGLRVEGINGAWSISGVPAGDYVVYGASGPDGLVRDPDLSIAGTELVRITVEAGADLSVSESMKITEALEVFSPGADGPTEVTSAPTLEWADDSSEEWYDVVVYDAFGEEVWTTRVDGVSGSATVSVPYGGPLDPGMYYQFRATSWSQSGNQDPAAKSTTEEVRGVFHVATPE